MQDQNPNDKIEHQDDVEEVIADHIEGASAQGAIATPASPGATYVQAEVVALRTAIAAILVALRDVGIIPT